MTKGTGLAVALALDGEPLPERVELGGGHLVEGQRSGLVGVDGGCRAQRLDVAEVLHDSPVFG